MSVTGIKNVFVAYDSALRPYDRDANRVWEDGRVEVTEKLDGSQFSWGYLDGELCFRSKGALLYQDALQALFAPAVEYIKQQESLLRNVYADCIFYGETMSKPRHNTVAYGAAAKNHVMLFGLRRPDGTWATHADLVIAAGILEIDVAPLLLSGSAAEVKAKLDEAGDSFMKQPSYLGGANIEGYIVRNLDVKPITGGRQREFLAVKYVSEAFKELNKATWRAENTGRGKLETFIEEFPASARWLKAVQRLEEAGKLTGTAKDIGPAIKSIQEDVLKEEEDYIKQRLFDIFKGDITRSAVKGFPQWFKDRLMAANAPGGDSPTQVVTEPPPAAAEL